MKRNNQTKNGKAPFFHKLFYNNRYLAVFSFIAAFITWIVVVMEFSPETTYKIQDVPVEINIENTTAEKLDLQPFTEKEYTVDPQNFISMGKATPFAGWKLTGECVLTVCNGKIVYKKQ